MDEHARTLKALMTYIRGLGGKKKIDITEAARRLKLSQTRVWTYVSFALRLGLLEEPGGKGSQVYVITSNGKTISQALKAEGERLNLPTKITKAATPTRTKKKAKAPKPIYHKHSEDSDPHLRAKIHSQADLFKEAEEKRIDVDKLIQMHGSRKSSRAKA